MLGYAQKGYGLTEATARVRDRRQKPRIPTVVVLRSLLLMLWVRLGSLNALEQQGPGGFWQRWVQGTLPSADTLGRVAQEVYGDDLRQLIFDYYRRRQRKKSLPPLPGGLRVLILDGHEMGASYLRQCRGCLKRWVKTAHGRRRQYYHRYVVALLLHGRGELLLDLEAQRTGEDEIAAARRLFERVIRQYPRAFDVVGGDALYLNPDFCRLVLQHGKDFVAVLKNEHRDLLTDARSLFALKKPVLRQDGSRRGQWWDIEGFTTWPQLGQSVRVVRSVETWVVRRQATRELEQQTSEWIWATSLCRSRADTETVVRIGHGRWAIENQGFNELVNEWHGDHLYRHHPNGIEVFYLLLFLAYNLFHAFLSLNLKPALRARYPLRYFVARMAAEFYSYPPMTCRPRPP